MSYPEHSENLIEKDNVPFENKENHAKNLIDALYALNNMTIKFMKTNFFSKWWPFDDQHIKEQVFFGRWLQKYEDCYSIEGYTISDSLFKRYLDFIEEISKMFPNEFIFLQIRSDKQKRISYFGAQFHDHLNKAWPTKIYTKEDMEKKYNFLGHFPNWHLNLDDKYRLANNVYQLPNDQMEIPYFKKLFDIRHEFRKLGNTSKKSKAVAAFFFDE